MESGREQEERLQRNKARLLAMGGVIDCTYGFDLGTDEWWAEATLDEDHGGYARVQGYFPTPADAMEALASELEERLDG